MNYWRKVSIITKVVEKVGGILEMDHYSLSSGLTKLVRVSTRSWRSNSLKG